MSCFTLVDFFTLLLELGHKSCFTLFDLFTLLLELRHKSCFALLKHCHQPFFMSPCLSALLFQLLLQQRDCDSTLRHSWFDELYLLWRLSSRENCLRVGLSL